MPNIKSAKKRVITNGNRALRNKAAKSALRTAVKKADLAILNNAEDKAEAVKVACAKLDHAATKGLIHKNNAANQKSRLVKAAQK